MKLFNVLAALAFFIAGVFKLLDAVQETESGDRVVISSVLCVCCFLLTVALLRIASYND